MLSQVRPRVAIKYDTTKTQVTTLANHSGHRQYREPIKTQRIHVMVEYM